jgi:HSP90 family molecular chaperone
MEKKMTKKEWFAVLASVVEASEMENKTEALAFINHEVELLEKKSAKSSQTKTQKENVEVMEKIKSALGEVGKAVTITELQAASAEMAEYSNQKLSALLKKLVESGEIVKTTEKKKSYFSLAE